MEETHGGRIGAPLYILHHDDYAELCNIRSMLIQMAEAAYAEDQPGEAHQRLPMTRAEIYFFFMEIASQIHEALNGVRRDNHMSPRSGWWQ
jgi:hypothetical protein